MKMCDAGSIRGNFTSVVFVESQSENGNVGFIPVSDQQPNLKNMKDAYLMEKFLDASNICDGETTETETVSETGFVNANFEDTSEENDMSPPLANTESKPSNNVLIPIRRTAVSVEKVWKQYGSGKRATPVLKNLSMTVPEGTIYSLLGASGCGKTTLLACTVGMRRLDGGEIKIFGSKPGTTESGVPGKRVGYMPQEIALYGEFTIQESMQYFGRIYGMTSHEIKERLTFLIKFLHLPSANRNIRSLSGGQQRRVSFAVALLHNPELLILDEPTVGVDPLLRQSIWNHLCELVSTGRTTVIITTHYIEEAKQADTIGLMRSGKLLAEDSPTNLLKQHQCISLEDVFLKLCMKEKSTNVTQANGVPNNLVEHIVPKNGTEHGSLALVSVYNDKNRKTGNEPTLTDDKGITGLTFHQSKEQLVSDEKINGGTNINNKYSVSEGSPEVNTLSQVQEDCVECCAKPWNFDPVYSYNKLRALVIKNLICMWRNIGFMLFIFVLPAMQVILFCLAIGREPRDMKFGVINNEVPGNETCVTAEGCSSMNLSCKFLDVLPKETVTLIPYDDEEVATEDVHKGLIWGYLMFSQNFSSATAIRGILGSSVENTTIIDSRVKVVMDMTNQQIAFSLQRTFLETYKKFTQNMLSDCKQDPVSGEHPLYFDTPIYGTDHPGFMEFMAPGIVLSIIFFMAVSLTGSAFITEKREGMLERSMVAGVTTGEVISAHMITQYVVMAGQTALVLIFMLGVFEIPSRGPIGWAIVLTLLQGTCGMAFGFLISTVCEKEQNSIQMALGSFYPNLLLSGVVWPIESMPHFLRSIAYLLPETLACESMRSLLNRGWDISHPVVWPGFVSSIIWSIIFWILAVLIARFSRSK